MSLDEISDIIVETITETKKEIKELLPEATKLAIIIAQILNDDGDIIDFGDRSDGSRSLEFDRMVHDILARIR